MNYRPFLHQHLPVSEIGLGGWQLAGSSDWNQITSVQAIRLVHYALDAGINFFDTAPNYGLGEGESRLGLALRGVSREKVAINTKFGHTSSGHLNFDPKYIRTSLEGSLRRLKTDYIDSFIIHNPPHELLNGHLHPHYVILEQLKEEGKIKAYGASLDRLDEMTLLMDTTESQVIEVFFNIFHQDVAKSFERAKHKGIFLINKIPLDSGWLSGRYDENSKFTGVRKRWSANDIHLRSRLIQDLKNILLPDYQLPSAALQFCLAHDAITTVIPGCSTTQQLDTLIQSSAHKMSEDMVQKIKRFYVDRVAGLTLPW